MTAFDHLRALAEDPTGLRKTARQQIEARTGRKLGCLRALKRNEPDTYDALKRLAIAKATARRIDQ